MAAAASNVFGSGGLWRECLGGTEPNSVAIFAFYVAMVLKSCGVFFIFVAIAQNPVAGISFFATDILHFVAIVRKPVAIFVDYAAAFRFISLIQH